MDTITQTKRGIKTASMSLADILPTRSRVLHALTRVLWHLRSLFRSSIAASVLHLFALNVTEWLTARLLLVASVSLRR